MEVRNLDIEPKVRHVDLALILNKGSALLIKEYGEDLLKFPGGVAMEGETPEQTLRRKLYQKLGVGLVAHELYQKNKINNNVGNLTLDTHKVEISGEYQPKGQVESITLIPIQAYRAFNLRYTERTVLSRLAIEANKGCYS